MSPCCFYLPNTRSVRLPHSNTEHQVYSRYVFTNHECGNISKTEASFTVFFLTNPTSAILFFDVSPSLSLSFSLCFCFFCFFLSLCSVSSIFSLLCVTHRPSLCSEPSSMFLSHRLLSLGKHRHRGF